MVCACCASEGKCRAQAFDLVISGNEAGGGTIRIHDPQVQQQVFGLLGISPDQVAGRTAIQQGRRYRLSARKP